VASKIDELLATADELEDTMSPLEGVTHRGLWKRHQAVNKKISAKQTHLWNLQAHMKSVVQGEDAEEMKDLWVEAELLRQRWEKWSSR
jgi:hypothetical protein